MKIKYAILQLKDGEENHYKRFFDSKDLPNGIDDVKADNYHKVYENEIDTEAVDLNDKTEVLKTLETLFTEFNTKEKPRDYIGHSLSVSDIIILSPKDSGISRGYYCEGIGFTTLSEFSVFIQEWKNNEIKENCNKIDEWSLTYDGENCTLLQDKENPEFFYADINGKIFEFGCMPSHQDVENCYIDYIAEHKLDEMEREIDEYYFPQL